MATIKEGFGGKPLTIKVNPPQEYSNNFELWIDQSAKDGGDRIETLSYITPDELRQLIVELKAVGKLFFE